MIDIRDNLRVIALVALCLLAALALFGPLGAGGGQGFGADPPQPDPVATATSDDAGEYGIELPTGEYDIIVDEVGFGEFETDIEVTEGNTTTADIDLSARETGTVSGTVTGPDGPVGGATVELRENGTDDVEQTVTADTDGTFETTLEVGEYIARIDEVGLTIVEESFSVTAGETVSVDISASAVDTGTLNGTVRGGGEPLAAVEVAAVNNATGTTVATTTTDENGSYELTVETGEVEVAVDNPRFESSSTTVLVQADQVQTVDIDLTPRETGTLGGAVTAGGEPVEGVTVSVRDVATGAEQAAATTDSSGEYEVELGAQSYSVVVDELLFGEFEQQVNLTADERTGLDIALDRVDTGTVEGVVTGDDGPLAGVDIEFIDPDDRLGEDIDGSFGDPTNLQYGLELSGGARIRGKLQGLTAEGLDLNPDRGFQVERTVADELDIEQINVRTRVQEGAVELYTQNVTQAEFADALGAAGLTASTGDIREGVTSATRQNAVTTITDRVDQTGFSGADVFTSSAVTGENFIVAEVPGVTRGELRDIISETGRVQIVAGFPETTENGTTVYNQTVLLTQDDIDSVDSAQRGDAQTPQPHVPIALTGEAGQRFASVTQAGGLTSPQGVGNCFFDEEVFDEPAPQHESQYCLFTVVDGEYVYGSSMGGDLAETINSGGFAQDPRFVMQTGSYQEAQELEVNIRAGELPTDIEIVTESFISPSLAQQFKPLALLTALVAWLSVSAVVYYWYRDVRIAIPMLLTASSEVFLLLGFASVVGLALDLSHIAGLIAVIGTGLDDLIIMADEILQRKEQVETGRVFQSRFRKAFWIIGMAAATTIIAMSPLAVLSLGDLQGFAIITIVGVLIGVGITRPAYGDVLRKLVLDDVKRTG
jgi:preprotein translocase subunit SecD